MAKSRITLEQVQHVAELARLALDESELRTMCEQLDSILDYMAALDELDVEGIEPTFYPVAMQAPLRDDVVKPSLAHEEALRAAPEQKAGAFSVPKVLDGD